MKILYCLNQIRLTGGVERIIIAKANWLVCHGFEVGIITTDQDNKESAFKIDSRIKHFDLGINYHRIKYLGYGRHYFKRLYTEILHAFKLKRIIDAEQPDIVVSISYQETTIIPLIKGKFKSIFEQHNCRCLFENPEQYKSLWHLPNRFRRQRWFKSLLKYDVHVFLNEKEAQAWNLDNSIVIPNFVTTKHVELNPCHNTKTVLHVGRLSWEKNQKLLLEAWSKVCSKITDWKLVICGDGPEKENLLEYIQQRGLSGSVIFKGNVDDIDNEYNASSIFIMTSLFESFGLAVCEAMLHGLPIVSTAAGGGIDNLVKDGFNGFKVAYNNPDIIAERLIKLMESSELRKTMGQNSQIAIQDYKIDSIMHKWLDLFNNLKNSHNDQN